MARTGKLEARQETLRRKEVRKLKLRSVTDEPTSSTGKRNR